MRPSLDARSPTLTEATLAHAAPLDWPHLLTFLRGRAIPGVESVEGETYRRSVAIGDVAGWLTVARAPRGHALHVAMSPSLTPHAPVITTALRRLFDLDAASDAIDAHLAQDPVLAPSIAARPGLRVPGAFDPFELAVRAILGQQVTVRAATTLSGRLVARFGARLDLGPDTAALDVAARFPRAEELARESEDTLASIGLPGARARTILALSRALASGALTLSTNADPEATVARLDALPGIGPWTAHYVAMRALSWPNAFPAEDLAVKKALGLTRAKALVERARAWEPWRAYAVMHLWAGAPASGG